MLVYNGAVPRIFCWQLLWSTTMSDTEIQTIRLSFSRTLKVAGEAIGGEVHLFFPGLIKDKIQEVHLKLRGFVETKITRQSGTNASGADSVKHVSTGRAILEWSSSTV
ncbi:hypothetical protein BC629DRAFT_161207 [Irpex lacteus]|nr:hypothetical protein BC629DRAFT_161207 [Irpex lacteus]